MLRLSSKVSSLVPWPLQKGMQTSVAERNCELKTNVIVLFLSCCCLCGVRICCFVCLFGWLVGWLFVVFVSVFVCDCMFVISSL